ncbi:hypothetical protein AVEN_162071-1 [Araneus ventricosus]|uniref:Uncharacterized protein n=1 Tax=Araneus ventricosus TaxID=182803 RepID=A0A4Y2L679_ARAVE|nr:hypothetical protein AVEN_162071-1 [Araneus ventricosus]
MEIALGISVILVCVHSGAEAQLNYAKQYIPQQVKYDDEGPAYGGIHYKSGISREPLSNSYENAREAIGSQPYPITGGSPYPQSEHLHQTGPVPSIGRYPDESEKAAHYQLKNPPQDHPQVIYYRQPESHNSYHSQDHTSQPEELQLSHGAEHHRPSHTSIIYPQQPSVPRPSHASLVHPQPAGPAYQTPKVADQDYKQIYPVAEHRQPNVPQQSHATLIHSQPSGPGYQTPKVADHESTPEYKQPAGPQPPNSRVVRDPRLPLYFTMYEKRIIQDPVDKYGKGPWRYLTYGHGITYGSKEPGKVFEKGYGYIRALGRDHCKLPENKCPRSDGDKPFEYEGRKEPYFGYRPH